MAAEEAAKDDSTKPKRKDEELAEVQVTGSRIVRKDMDSNSPLVTVDRQKLEDSSYISVEETLNDLPQFMAGGVGMSSGSVTSLTTQGGTDGGRGTGDMFNQGVLPDNAGIIGLVVPGAANVNLRGLGSNRSLTLIDGHRGMPLTASMTVDLNSIPSIAIGNIEVITGGASAVYGADALAGVTNIKFRDNFEGMEVRVRGGVNEVGDGGETQVSTLFGARSANGKGSAMMGIEWSKRQASYWKNRSFFRDVMASPYSSSGDYIFAWDPDYTSGAATGSYFPLQKAWSGNAPNLTPALLNQIFPDRTCVDGTGAQLNCIASTANAPYGGGWYFNPDGSIYIRSSQTGTGTAASPLAYYGPQGYKLPADGTPQSPNEVTCSFAGSTVPGSGLAVGGPFAGRSCNPTTNRIDYGRWLSSPREAFTLFGRGTFDFNDHLSAFANMQFASSDTYTRREPAPFSGNYVVVIPFHTTGGGDDVYLPSVITAPAAGQVVGQTVAAYLPGGAKGTECPTMGGCSIAQAFPLPGDVFDPATHALVTKGPLRLLLESRPTSTITTASSPFRTLSACNQYSLATATTPGAQLNAATGQYYTVQADPNTGQPLATCGPNSGWAINTQLGWLPPRQTTDTERLYQFATGLRGDLGLSDWTWELYTSYGDSETQVQYTGFTSFQNYISIMSAPNYGEGLSLPGPGSKYLTCTSGINPFDPDLVPSQDCQDAILSNQIDRNSMKQRIHEFNAQGHLFDLPAGEVRGSVGLSYRRNDYSYRPDSLREADYIGDVSAGQFASGSIDAAVSAKEVYGEMLVPLLKDLPLIHKFELELGARHSNYSTGQKVDTWKALGSWEPTTWLRARGGYNRAERAPNIAELYATPSGSAQLTNTPFDPCSGAAGSNLFFPGPTPGSSLNNSATTDPAIRAKVQQLCSDQINAWGGNNSSIFQSNLDGSTVPLVSGGLLLVGNPGLKNERGDTWTMGIAFSSPFQHPLLNRITGTVDWYEARVTDPIDVLSTTTIVNGCFNVNGLNPDYKLDDPHGYCSLIERDPVTGNILRIYDPWSNLGKLVIRGLDVALNWSANMSDLGLPNVPGRVSLSVNGNYLIDQIQRYGGDVTQDYAGFGGASRIRASTGLSYNWGRNRVALTWQYRLGTQTATIYAATPAADGTTSPTIKRNPLMAGYGTTNLFNLTAGTRIGPVNTSISVNNVLNTKPKPGGYDLRDPLHGFGSFSPFDDLVGRRYSINLSVDF